MEKNNFRKIITPAIIIVMIIIAVVVVVISNSKKEKTGDTPKNVEIVSATNINREAENSGENICESESWSVQVTENQDESFSETEMEPETETLTEIETEPETESSGTGESEPETESSGAVENESATQAQGNGTPLDIHGMLHVNGTNLYDENGEIFQLRGVSTHGMSWFPGYVNYDAFLTLRDDWGANCIRLAMYTYENGGYCISDDNHKAYLKELADEGVDACTELGMYVIIDWHVLNDRDPNTYIDQAKEFFSEMSLKYKDYENVIYEICNEPNGGVSWESVKSYAEAVIPVIKSNNPDAIILVGTPTWSQDIDQAAKNPITGYSNIMYTLHFYADTHRDFLRNRLDDAVKAGLPVFVSEFGICDASGSGGNNYSEGQLWIDKLDSYGISYCIWNLSNKNETSALIASSCNKVSGWAESELSESGKWYRQILLCGTSGYSGNTVENVTTVENETTSENVTTAAPNNVNETNTESTNIAFSVICEDENLDAVADITNSWSDGTANYYQLSIRVSNKGNEDKNSWSLILSAEGKMEVSQNWNCNVSETAGGIKVVPVEYNSNIQALGSVGDIGIIVKCAY